MWKWIIGVVVVVALAAGGWYYYQNVYLPNQTAAAEPAFETLTVGRGDIAATVNGTGGIAPEAEVSLSFRNPGRVQDVLVSEGEAVTEGQLLATLDTTDLALSLAQSKINLQIAQAQLAKLEKPPEENDILSAQAAVEVAQSSVAGAEASLNAARAGYSQLFADNTAAQRQVNEANLRQAEVNLKSAQQQYNRVKDQANIGELPQSAQLESSTLAYEVALAQTQLTDEGPTDSQVANSLNQIAQGEVQLRQAQANLISAQNNLSKLLDGPSQEDLDIARAQVQQSQLSQLQAENSLANSQMVAPFDGVISGVNIRLGEMYSGGPAAISMADLGQFHLNVLVDENDVRAIEVGQSVALRIDALPDTPLTGTVTQISPASQNVGGVVAYELTIVPDATDAPLREGMSATAVITTADVPNAILLPNRFITLNRETNEASVYKMVDGTPVPQSVELGLRNETVSQIVSGLDEGDVAVLVTLTGAEQLQRAFSGQ